MISKWGTCVSAVCSLLMHHANKIDFGWFVIHNFGLSSAEAECRYPVPFWSSKDISYYAASRWARLPKYSTEIFQSVSVPSIFAAITNDKSVLVSTWKCRSGFQFNLNSLTMKLVWINLIHILCIWSNGFNSIISSLGCLFWMEKMVQLNLIPFGWFPASFRGFSSIILLDMWNRGY